MNVYACSKTYNGRKVLDFPGLELQPGRIYAIIGSNGCGKSTLGKILSGIIKADKKGPVTDACTVGYMPQRNFAFRMSTRKNILQGGGTEDLARYYIEALHLTDLSEKRADRLSGGETARMALARLMMKNFNLVILDEPTAAMDMETSLLSEKIIQEYVAKSNCAMLLITHSLSQARRLADEILFFQNGQLLETGPAASLLQNPKTDKLRQFLDFYGGL